MARNTIYVFEVHVKTTSSLKEIIQTVLGLRHQKLYTAFGLSKLS